MAWRQNRRRTALLSGALAGGSAEILDFLLPLWAGPELGASSAQIGAMVAIELALTFLARPVAGWLADTRERTRVAASGAVLYGASCLGYAQADSLPLAFVAAAAGGVGGALLWVAIRAIMAERLDADSGAFAGLFSAVAFGSWFFWVPAMVLLPEVGYRGLFTGLAVVNGVAAGALLLAHPAPPTAVRGGESLRVGARRMAPLLGVVVLTNLAEAGVGLLLLLHLQHAFELEVYQIALVFLPGGIAMTVFPRPLHRLVERLGRRLIYVAASLASAAFAVGLAFAPSPVTVAVLWILTGTAWAAVIPIQQAVAVEVSGEQVGRGMSLLGNAALAGAAIGSLTAGAIYQGSSWQWVCAVFALVNAAGAVLGPRALRRLGVRNHPETEFSHSF